MWSGPRNISTALLRSFSNRDDTIVYDEPFYSYYLKETGLNHPMRDKIIDFYPTKEKEVIETILKDKKGIYYLLVLFKPLLLFFCRIKVYYFSHWMIETVSK